MIGKLDTSAIQPATANVTFGPRGKTKDRHDTKRDGRPDERLLNNRRNCIILMKDLYTIDGA